MNLFREEPFAFWGFCSSLKSDGKKEHRILVWVVLLFCLLWGSSWGISLPQSLSFSHSCSLSPLLCLPLLYSDVKCPHDGLCCATCTELWVWITSFQLALIHSSKCMGSHTLKLLFRLKCVNTGTLDFKLHLFDWLLSIFFLPSCSLTYSYWRIAERARITLSDLNMNAACIPLWLYTSHPNLSHFHFLHCK